MSLYLSVVMLMSLVTFILFGADKRRAVRKQWRIPERTLLLFSLFFGAAGAFIGMYVFHHKTRKWKFRIAVPLLMVVQILLLAVPYRL